MNQIEKFFIEINGLKHEEFIVSNNKLTYERAHSAANILASILNQNIESINTSLFFSMADKTNVVTYEKGTFVANVHYSIELIPLENSFEKKSDDECKIPFDSSENSIISVDEKNFLTEDKYIV